MKVILEPTVTVIATTQFHPHPKYPIPNDGTDAEKLGSFAAKGCYDSFGAEGRSNIANQTEVIAHAHGSVIEHPVATIFVEGITRALTLEFNRHRQFGISQRSTRYTKEEDASIVLEPYYADIFRRYQFRYEGDEKTWHTRNPDNYDFREVQLLHTHLEKIEEHFKQYRDEVETLVAINPLKLTGFDLRKWARGKARNCLPHSLETRVTYTGNYRAWRWFVQARSDKHAEPEIRRLANTILTALRPWAPTYFADFHCISEYDGIPEWMPEHKKI